CDRRRRLRPPRVARSFAPPVWRRSHPLARRPDWPVADRGPCRWACRLPCRGPLAPRPPSQAAGFVPAEGREASAWGGPRPRRRPRATAERGRRPFLGEILGKMDFLLGDMAFCEMDLRMSLIA